MIMLLAVFASLMTPATDTVWWQTPGAVVTQHKEPTWQGCSLAFHTRQDSITFDWQRDQPLHVTITRSSWHFSPTTAALQARMQIGDQWLASQDALGKNQSVVFLVGQPIDDLLLRADHLTISLTDDEYTQPLPPTPKLVSLMLGLRRCRELLRL